MLLSLHSNILKLKQIQEFTITMKMKTLHSNIFKLKQKNLMFFGMNILNFTF